MIFTLLSLPNCRVQLNRHARTRFFGGGGGGGGHYRTRLPPVNPPLHFCTHPISSLSSCHLQGSRGLAPENFLTSYIAVGEFYLISGERKATSLYGCCWVKILVFVLNLWFEVYRQPKVITVTDNITDNITVITGNITR